MSDEREQLVPYPPPSVVAAADWRPTRALKFIAFLFILVGVLGITEMLIELIIFGGLDIDLFAILALFMGRGLLRWQNGWRKCAVFFAWRFIISGAGVAFISFLDICFNMFGGEVRIGTWRGGPWFGPPLGLIIFGVAYWVQRTLAKPDVVWRCENRNIGVKLRQVKQVSWNPLRWQFSLGSLFLATIVVAFVLLRVTADEVLYDIRLTTSRSIASTFQRVDYAVGSSRLFKQPDRLLYAVLSTDGVGDSKITGIGQSRMGLRHEVWVNMPDGSETIVLPSKHQLYEIVDGELRSRDERVTLEELEDFIKSRTADWTLNALLKHAEKMRARQKNGAPH